MWPDTVVVKCGGGSDVSILDMSVLHAQSSALAFWVREGLTFLKTFVGVNFIFHCIFEKSMGEFSGLVYTVKSGKRRHIGRVI